MPDLLPPIPRLATEGWEIERRVRDTTEAGVTWRQKRTPHMSPVTAEGLKPQKVR